MTANIFFSRKGNKKSYFLKGEIEMSEWNWVVGKVEGREEEVRVAWMRDGKGGLWVKMRFEGKEKDWMFKGSVKFDGVVDKVEEK